MPCSAIICNRPCLLVSDETQQVIEYLLLPLPLYPTHIQTSYYNDACIHSLYDVFTNIQCANINLL